MSEGPARSLLERAARAFDFEAAAQRRALPVADDAVVPVPEPRPPIGRRGRVDAARLAAAGFILPDVKSSALVEEMRLVKRQLLRATAGGAAKDRMILVASAREGEGKSFCALNLALSLASERDWEVLLVDADVAKPSLVAMLGLDDGPGLLDAIADPTLDIESCVVRTDIGALSVLPTGASSHAATELIASDRMPALLQRLAEKGDRRILLFDSPPALAHSAASALAHHVGQTVLVVRADATGDDDLREAATLLAGCPRLQLLLNAVSFGGRGRRFGRYYGTEG